MDSRVRTTFLLAVLTVLIVWMGGQFGGSQGMTMAFILAAAMNLGSYWFSDKIVLSMYRAQPLDERQAPELYRVVRDLAMEAQLPMPRIFVIPQDTPNAFATGRNPENAVVAVTEGLLRLLSLDEARGAGS
jgi:heat shock protein HtpX